jgi:PAS domain S-box-containing protein
VLQRPPDLLVSDVMMPKLDGFGLLKAIRADERTATLPVILLSARAGEESRVEGIAARADDYIVKPFTARELVARVETQLALSRIRRETEEAIRESEARFRALVTASSDVVYRMSPDWSEMRQLRGHDFIADTEEPSHTWLQRYIHPDDRPRVMAVIHEAIRTSSVFELEHRVLHVDGSSGWAFSRAIPLQNANGEIIEWFGTASDVTAKKQAQESLDLSLAKLSQQARLLDLSNDAILVRDGDDRIQYWNRGATEIYGYTREEALGRVTHELLRTEFPEPLERIKEILSRDDRWSGELVHTRRDGVKIFVVSRWALERDGNKKVARILETNSEITQRKQAEVALRRSEKLAALGRMAATISHEINNPLESLVNLLYLATTSEGLPADTRDLLAEADAELQRVAHITRQALGFYRESNAAESVSVNALVESAIALLKNKIGAKHVRIEKQWRVAQQIKAVAGELRQVFSNLLVNCLDAVDEGGTVKMRVGLCTLSDDRPGIRITFSDNGKGIEAAMRSRIFEPLYTTKGEVGTGLGLWVSKQIVEKHKGRIQMRSSTAGERRGSTFSILLER